MNQIKTIRDAMRLIAATSAVLLATGAGSAFAQQSTVDTANQITGAYSDNVSHVDIHHNTDLNVHTNNHLNNNVLADFNTGKNDASFNTVSEGTGDTGMISADVMLNNDTTGGIGGTLGGLTLDPQDVSVSHSNYATGAESNNENNTTIHNDQQVHVTTNNNVTNSVNLKANTGKNTSDFNTQSTGNGMTGDINFGVDVTNTTPVTDLSGINLGGGTTDVSGSNQLTGFASDNENNTHVNQNTNVDVNTNTNINNNVKLNGDTGNNDNSFDTITGGQSTGGINANVSIDNTAQ